MHFKYVEVEDLANNWRSKGKRYGHPFHSIVSRTGAFPSSLVEYFIKYELRKQKGVLLDPFCGKGTAPFEACCNGMRGIGNDLLPDAFCITHAKIQPPKKYSNVSVELKKLRGSGNVSNVTVPDYVKILYHPNVLPQLLSIREQLNPSDVISELSQGVDTPSLRSKCFIIATLLGILHGSSSWSLSLPCNHSFAMTKGHVENYIKKHWQHPEEAYPNINVMEKISERINHILLKPLPLTFMEGEVHLGDATKFLGTIDDNYAEILLTSPPYLNKQTYAWDNRVRLWFLGYDFKEIKKDDSYLEVASRQNYLKYLKVCIAEMSRVLKKKRPLVMVIGDIDGLAEDVGQIVSDTGMFQKKITIMKDAYKNHRKSSVYSRNVNRMDKIIIANKE